MVPVIKTEDIKNNLITGKLAYEVCNATTLSVGKELFVHWYTQDELNQTVRLYKSVVGGRVIKVITDKIGIKRNST